ncbi:hypothetical protein T01_10276 [Trichinella spiralis]|uniref:Uncharacterized protein n=1 Tax=Trichinella spiralis TaxID=6334 RepID=A0A0V1BXY7_TRISP|nr:hypothetical protein T01_10276 [Trichinella spiralis]
MQRDNRNQNFIRDQNLLESIKNRIIKNLNRIFFQNFPLLQNLTFFDLENEKSAVISFVQDALFVKRENVKYQCQIFVSIAFQNLYNIYMNTVCRIVFNAYYDDLKD